MWGVWCQTLTYKDRPHTIQREIANLQHFRRRLQLFFTVFIIISVVNNLLCVVSQAPSLLHSHGYMTAEYTRRDHGKWSRIDREISEKHQTLVVVDCNYSILGVKPIPGINIVDMGKVISMFKLQKWSSGIGGHRLETVHVVTFSVTRGRAECDNVRDAPSYTSFISDFNP